jgi:hypothetical protein
MGKDGPFMKMFTHLSVFDIFYEIEASEYKFIKIMLPKIIKILVKNKRLRKTKKTRAIQMILYSSMYQQTRMESSKKNGLNL